MVKKIEVFSDKDFLGLAETPAPPLTEPKVKKKTVFWRLPLEVDSDQF